MSRTLPGSLPARQNFAWMAVGNGIFSVCSFLMLAAIRKLGTGEDLGIYSLGLAFSQPIVFFSQLNLASILATDIKRERSLNLYVSLRGWMTAAGMLVALFVAPVVTPGFNDLKIVWIVTAAALVDSLSDIAYGAFRLEERMDFVASSLLLRGPLSLLGVVVGAAIYHSVESAAWFSLAASVIVTVLYDFPKLKQVTKIEGGPITWLTSNSYEKLRSLAVFAFPMGLVMMLSSLMLNIPRYRVDATMSHQALAIFSAMAAFMTVGRIPVMAMGQAATPKLARAFHDKDWSKFWSLNYKLFAISIGICAASVAVAWFAGAQILSVAFSNEYAQYGPLFTVLLAVSGLGFLASIVGFSLTAAQAYNVQLPHLLSTVVVTTAMAFYTIPSMGHSGAVATLGIAFAWQFAVGLYLLHRTVQRASWEVS